MPGSRGPAAAAPQSPRPASPGETTRSPPASSQLAATRISSQTMIKLLHIAAVHIGMENYGRLNPEPGLNTRLHDFLDTLDEAVTHAIDERVDAVVVAGDVYKSRDPSPTHQRELARRIIRLIKHDVHVVLVPGNHDTPMAAGRATSVDIFRELELPNVTVLRRIAASRIETRNGPLQVVALPWLTRSTFLAHDDFRNLPLD